MTSGKAVLRAALERHRAGHAHEAAVAYESVLIDHPDDADALNLLATVRRAEGRLDEALRLAKRAGQAAPNRADIHYNLGNALTDAGDFDAAVAAFRASLALEPGNAGTACNLGIALGKRGDFLEAADAYRSALRLDPKNRIAAHNLGNARHEMGESEAAADVLRAVAGAFPTLAEARYNLARVLLGEGDFANGFAAYEARWQTEGFSSPRRHATIPSWDGKPFRNKRLLVHAEQGLGDTIQFARLIPLAASLGGEVVFDVQSALVPLLKTLPGASAVVGEGEADGPFDHQSPLLGLPFRLGLTLGSIPAKTPYLHAEPERVAFWRARLKPDGRPLIGVGWRGNPASPADRGRSLKGPDALRPLASIPGVRLVALHKMAVADLFGDASGWRVPGLPFAIEHPGPDFDAAPAAFLDTAAVLSFLDHVVTTDTSLAHLAGALARPTTVLLKAVPDWRWLKTRGDTPWYPGMRLLRQTVPGDFDPVIREAARLLSLSAY